MAEALQAFSDTPIYLVWMIFLGAFPVITAMLAIDSSRRFVLDREDGDLGILPDEADLRSARQEFGLITVMISARNEEALLGATIESVLRLDWPRVELFVIDDGSTDGTFEVAKSFIRDPSPEGGHLVGEATSRDSVTIHLLRHPESLGKATGLDEVLPLAEGDLALVLDADGRPDRRAIELMAPHFVRYPNLGAVTGNPRVANTDTILARLQAIEFSSTVAVLRRAQAGWGRINTCSGVCTLYRKRALVEVGGFDPYAATEDIMISWQLQMSDWDIFYEPRALFAMRVPARVRNLFRQRRRWGRGLGEVLRVFGPSLFRRSSYRMWPVALEGFLSIVWCFLLVLAVAFWAVAALAGVPGLGNSPLLDHWGIIIVIISILQIVWGVRIDAPEDPEVSRMLWVAPLYPLFYWLFNSLASVSGSVAGLVLGPRRKVPVAWKPDRIEAHSEEAARAGTRRRDREGTPS
ncbi:MAG: glycosyltransferase family 2 protein [Solirubrobacterales bacterium]